MFYASDFFEFFVWISIACAIFKNCSACGNFTDFQENGPLNLTLLYFDGLSSGDLTWAMTQLSKWNQSVVEEICISKHIFSRHLFNIFNDTYIFFMTRSAPSVFNYYTLIYNLRNHYYDLVVVFPWISNILMGQVSID